MKKKISLRLSGILTVSDVLGSELINDPTMEYADASYWPAYSSPATREKSTAEKYAGSQSLHIVSGGGAMGAQQQGKILIPGATYRISVWAKCVTGTAYLYSNVAGVGLQVVGSTTATSWTLLTGDVVCATEVARSLLLLMDGSNEGYFDNASLKRVL